MSANLSPVFGAGWQGMTNSGTLLAGGKLYAYVAGTVNPAPTWTDATQGTLNANPMTLDSSGRPQQEIWLASGARYKFVVTDSLGNQVGYASDNISGLNDATYTQTPAVEWPTGGVPTYISATSFSVTGDQTTILQALRRVKLTVSGGLAYGTIVSSSYGAGVTTVVVTNDSISLDSGASVMQYSILSASPTSLPATVLSSATYQAQTPVAFTTGGTSTTYTLTPSPAIAATPAGMHFDVTFNSTCGASPTLAISGLAALPLVKGTSAGGYTALVAGDVTSGWVSQCVVLPGATQILVRQTASTAVLSNSRALAMALIFGL